MTDRSDEAKRPALAVGETVPPRATAPIEGDAALTKTAPHSVKGKGLRQVTITNEAAVERPSGERSLLDRNDADDDPYVGCTIDDRYLVERILGEGGMGVVYLCRHTIIGKRVAMKILRANLARNEEVTERFLNEAKSASSIGNPHIIDISDFGRLPDGSTYFVMEYLEGTTLATLVDGGGSVPIGRLFQIAEQLTEGLFAAHQAGIVHRDLKPDNIFLVPRRGLDFVKILDFGIAKAGGTEGKLTRVGQVFGTPHYMSPEQAAGLSIDHRADIYSLGVILYEMACGKVPFDADTFMGILTQHMYKAPAPIRALVPAPQDIPPSLEAIILKCLSKRPEQRYQTMQALANDLRKARDGHVPGAVTEMLRRPGGLTSDDTESAGRWPLYAAGLGGVLVFALAAAILSGRPSADSTTPPLKPEAPLLAVPQPTAVIAEAQVNTRSHPTSEAPTRHQVVLAVAPLDAHVFLGDEDLGTSPVLVEIGEGESLTLLVKKKGYKEAKLQVDGSQKKLSVTLQPQRSATPKPESQKTPSPTPPRRTSSTEIIDPWE